MASASARDPLGHHLVTPEKAAFLFIDYQPAQHATVRDGSRAPPQDAVSTDRQFTVCK
jgi:hypothetical protein